MRSPEVYHKTVLVARLETRTDTRQSITWTPNSISYTIVALKSNKKAHHPISIRYLPTPRSFRDGMRLNVCVSRTHVDSPFEWRVNQLRVRIPIATHARSATRCEHQAKEPGGGHRLRSHSRSMATHRASDMLQCTGGVHTHLNAHSVSVSVCKSNAPHARYHAECVTSGHE